MNRPPFGFWAFLEVLRHEREKGEINEIERLKSLPYGFSATGDFLRMQSFIARQHEKAVANVLQQSKQSGDAVSERDARFLGFVEMNERAWGQDSYPGRPTLHDILNTRIVAFWRSTKHRDPAYRVTVHERLTEIHEHAAQMLLHSKTRLPDRRLARVYVDRRRMVIKGIKVVFELED